MTTTDAGARTAPPLRAPARFAGRTGYVGQWQARARQRIVASGATANQLTSGVNNLGTDRTVLFNGNEWVEGEVIEPERVKLSPAQ